MEAKRPGGANAADARLGAPTSGPSFSSPQLPDTNSNSAVSRRGWKEEEVLVSPRSYRVERADGHCRQANQLGNEESIEAIIRRRTLEAFQSRCPFFYPRESIGKEWWELANSGRSGRGPDVPGVNS